MKKVQRYSAWILLIVFVFQFVLSSCSVDVSADSNSIRTTMIQLAKKKSLDTISGLGSLTESELQMVGTYLSNFYVPFSTELVTSEEEGEIKEKQVQALVSSCNWDEELAEQVVAMCWEMSISSAKPLYLGELTDDDGISTLDNLSEDYPKDGEDFLATYAGFLTLMSEDSGSDSFCVYWKDGDTKKVVFDMKSDGWTASTLMYCLLMDQLPYQSGVGSSLIDLVLDSGDKLSAKAYLKSWNAKSDDLRLATSVFASQMYMDCFGNILLDFKTHKYVLLPASANPYIWYDSKSGESSTGKNVNFVNLFSLGEAGAGHISPVREGDYNKYCMGFYTGSNSLFNLETWKIQRGLRDIDLDTSWSPFSKGAGKQLLKLADKYFKSDWGVGADKVYFPNMKSLGNLLNSEYSVTNDDGSVSSDAELKDYSFTKSDLNLSNDRSGTGIGVFDDLVFVDKILAFSAATDAETESYFKKKDGGIFSYTDGAYSIDDNGLNSALSFTTKEEDYGDNMICSTSSQKYMVGVYLSYTYAFFGENSDIVGFKFAKNNVPKPSTGSVNWANIKMNPDKLDNEIKNMVYYLLHPTEGFAYVAKLVKNKLGAVLVSWHEDMVGRGTASYTTGGTKYLGFTGYVTLPNLNELSWTAWLLDNYNNIMVYLILIILTIMITYIVIGAMTVQRAILGTILFGIAAFFPPLCINAVTSTVNLVCDGIYGEKFTYWALVQHEQYFEQLSQAEAEKSKDAYLDIISGGNNDNSGSGYSSVKIKWMTPKKDNYLAGMSNQLEEDTGSSSLMNMQGALLNNQLSGQSYDTSDLYLYRDYVDLFTYSSTSYEAIRASGTVNDDNFEEAITAGNLEKVTYTSGENLFNMFYTVRSDKDEARGTKYAVDKGFLYDSVGGKIDNKAMYSSYLLMNSQVAKEATDRLDKFDDLQESGEIAVKKDDIKPFLGYAQDKFGVSIGDLNTGSEALKNGGAGRFYYGVYSESPYYYLIYNLYDQAYGTGELNFKSNPDISGLIKLFTKDNQSYFYNYSAESESGYGRMRDYMNMHDFFYYVVPYLKYCNSIVERWDDVYGMTLYEDVDIKFGADGTITNMPDFDADPEFWTEEMKYKYWHNYNVTQLFNFYTPWVDTMYDCKYAQSETIVIAGEKFQVLDPLDPTSYYTWDYTANEMTAGRLMVFSESEMNYYGLKWTELTTVEQKIITFGKNTYSNLLQLADYYSFKDDVLTTSAAMLMTFEFNELFSQVNPFGSSYIMYPQNYELKAFTYDAYLRLILTESTGESLTLSGVQQDAASATQKATASKSFYQTLVENSSLTCAFLMLGLDMLAVYAIPALKLFFLIMIFFMSILMIVSAAIKLEMNIVKTTWDALISPLFKFLGVSIGMAWVVSLFMSNGNTAVTGRGGFTIKMGDPTMTVLVMIIINIVVLILYWKICKKCWKQFIDFAKAIATSIGGAVGGTVSKMFGTMIGGKQISDSAARGTAKARGRSNQPLARNVDSYDSFDRDRYSGSGGQGSSTGGSGRDMASTLLAATAVGTIGAEVSGKSKLSAEAIDKKCGGASNQGMSEGLRRNLKRTEKKLDRKREVANSSERRAGAYKNARASVNSTREALRYEGSLSKNPVRKASAFIQDKKLAAEGAYYTGMEGLHSSIGGVKRKSRDAVRRAGSGVDKVVTDNVVGRSLGLDAKSRRSKAVAKAARVAAEDRMKATRSRLKNSLKPTR